jgi:bifunctional non-homologous end joining protein LigD
MSKVKKLDLGPYEVDITHPEKVFFPDDGITKGEFVEYHRQIAAVMVPHIKGRPLNMDRFPDGIKGQEFYQQSAPENLPDWVDRLAVKKEGGEVTHILCNNSATLVYIANHGCITPHVWLSRERRLDSPDQMIFDLDPPGDDFEPVREGAGYLKKILDDIGLVSFVKSTGSHGLHVVVPLIPDEGFEDVRALAGEIAQLMVRREPEKFTTEQRKDKRRLRLFIDIMRNAYAQTAVAPYAVRARKGAPVAAPLHWDELKDPDQNAQTYNIRNIFKRLEKFGDPWKDIERHAQSLKSPRRKLEEIVSE